MHEIMVSEEEANHCVKRGDYYPYGQCCLNCKVDSASGSKCPYPGVQFR